MNEKEKKHKNYGIAILRIILSFMVVVDHFYDLKKQKKFAHILYYHIPTFFLMSFYYTNNTFITFNIPKIKLRFQRLVIPYIFWNIFSFILNNIYFLLLKRLCYHTIYHFIENLLNGHMFIIALWFQTILIFTTLIVVIIIFSFKKEYLLIFQIMMIVSYRFQYSGENYHFCIKYLTIHNKFTYGRFIETFPNSLSGLFIGSSNIPNKFKLYKLRTIIFSILGLILISKYNFDENLLGFKYGGIRNNIAAVLIFLVFFFSFNIVTNKKIQKLLNIITNYTAGIYFIHNLIGKSYFLESLLGNKIHSTFGCLIIYFISYMFCFFMDKIIGNTKLKHLIK